MWGGTTATTDQQLQEDPNLYWRLPTHPPARSQAWQGAVKLAKKEVKAARGLILQEDLKHRRRVLRRLGYVDEEGIVTLKVGGGHILLFQFVGGWGSSLLFLCAGAAAAGIRG